VLRKSKTRNFDANQKVQYICKKANQVVVDLLISVRNLIATGRNQEIIHHFG